MVYINGIAYNGELMSLCRCVANDDHSTVRIAEAMSVGRETRSKVQIGEVLILERKS